MTPMDTFTPQIVGLLALLTIAGQLLSIMLLVVVLLRRKSAAVPACRWVAAHGLLFMLIIAATATAGSLYFSEIALWTPCKLCWFQRIFMYPQVPLLLVALWKHDRGIATYILLLSVIGMVFSSVHYTEQVMAALQPPSDPLEPCDLTGVSCASAPSFYFGYITIPMMAFTAFLLNALIARTAMRMKS